MSQPFLYPSRGRQSIHHRFGVCLRWLCVVLLLLFYGSFPACDVTQTKHYRFLDVHLSSPVLRGILPTPLSGWTLRILWYHNFLCHEWKRSLYGKQYVISILIGRKQQEIYLGMAKAFLGCILLWAFLSGWWSSMCIWPCAFICFEFPSILCGFTFSWHLERGVLWLSY